jgi:ABC-2 type transport system ATP-binding protein
MPLAIESNLLTKRYLSQKEGPPAIEAISLQVPEGELYGLVGPDGAGKTTLLRILASVMEPTSGSACLVGFDLHRQAEKARHYIGYMPQAFSLYPDLTVRENIHFFADLHGVSKTRRKERVAELLEFARLTAFTARRSENLSGGMRKKLALACALIHEPKVLLLDEPTTGVDPVSRRELWHLLSRVVQQGVTVMISTPYMDEAERCHTVGILNQGHLLINGRPAELEAQLPFQVVEVQARPRRTLREVVATSRDVLAWRAVGDRLRLAVADPLGAQQHLAASLDQAGATTGILRQARPTMEDVFIHLVDAGRDGA